MAESQKNQTEKENIVELKTNIYLLSIIGEVEGHESLGERTKATRYEHILPALARAEEDKSIDGLLILLNTVGGDVEAGLAIAEMIASMRKPAVSLVLGGGHSIGVPLAVAADYSLIVPSATMVIHPVRTNGMFIGVAQTYRNMEKTQDRITGFVSAHSKITKERLEELMLDTKMLVKDVGTMLDGPQAVEEGLIDEVGGIKWAKDQDRESQTESWGYGKPPKSEAEFLQRLEGQIGAVLELADQVWGYCYTQLTDVEQEQNGVYYYDRTPKFDTERIRAIFGRNPGDKALKKD